MNLLNKLTIKNLKLNKKRTIVTIIGIILSTALICAVASIYNSAINSLITYQKKGQGNFHYVYYDVRDKEIKTFLNNRKIESIYCLKHMGYAHLEMSKNEYKPYIHVVSLDKDSMNNLSLSLISGRLPQNDNEVLIPFHLKTNARVFYELGDEITLDIGKRTSGDVELNQHNPYQKDGNERIIDTVNKKYKVVGIINRPPTSIEPYSAPGYTFITLNNSLVQEGFYDLFTRYTKSGIKDQYRVTANILGVDEEIFEKMNNSEIKHFSEKDMELYVKEMEKAKYQFNINSYLISLESDPLSISTANSLGIVVLIVSLIIVFTSVFCIKNSFDISITEKTRQYGMLISIGATKKQIRKNVFYEAFILGIIGIPLGILFGLLATYILIIVSNYYLGNSIGTDIILEFSVSNLAIIISVILGVLTIYLSSLRSAIRASHISPIESIRNNNDIKINKKKIKGNKLIYRIFGIGGELGVKNMHRNKKKYRTTSISIAVSVFVFIALSSFVNLAFSEVKDEYADKDYNISLTMNTMGKNETYQKLLDVLKMNSVEEFNLHLMTGENIINYKYSSEYQANYQDLLDEEGVSEFIAIVGLSEESWNGYLKRLGVTNLSSDIIFVDTIKYNIYDEEGKTLKQFNTRKFSYNKGDVITTTKVNDNLKSNFEIGYVTNIRPFGYTYNTYNNYLIIKEDTFKKIYPYNNYTLLIKSSDANKLQNDIESLLNGEEYHLSNIEEHLKTTENLFTLIAIFLYGFIIVISLIGITNIFNTITTSMNLRRGEFAIFKSIGMTKKEFRKMIRLESIFMVGKALFFGIVIGIILSYLIYYYFKEGTYLTYSIPIKAIAISIIVTYLLVTLIMSYSIKKINRQNTIETIRCENI